MQREYEISKKIPFEKFSETLDKVWKELQTDSTLRGLAIKEKIDIEQVNDINRDQVITVKRKGAGSEPTTALIILVFLQTFGPVIAKIVQDLWDKFFLDMIEEDLGEGVLKRKRED